MTTDDFIKLHTAAALQIMADRSLSGQVERANDRADRLVVAMRHLICCWTLKEATEEQLNELTDRYADALKTP